MIHISETTKVDLQELYETIVWPLYAKDSSIQPLDYLIKIIMMYIMDNEGTKRTRLRS